MKIRTDEDIRAFQKALDRCERPVWLVSPHGEQFNLKTARGQIEGISCLLKDKWEQSEIFTSSFRDEAVMFEFVKQYPSCA